MTSQNQCTVAFHENSIAPYAQHELDRLYGNIFSSLPHLNFYHRHEQIHTYSVLNGGDVVTLFLFKYDTRSIIVLNEGITVDDEDIHRFARHVFARFPAARVIRFNMVSARIQKTSLTIKVYPCADDIVLSLPQTCEAYFSILGKSTRSYIKRYQKQLRNVFPSLQFSIQINENVSEQDIRDIIKLNGMRMASKHKMQAIGHHEAERMITLTKTRGMVCLMKLNGKVCAGTVNLSAGDNYFLETIAHDPAYNAYGLGTLCCYLTICECIARGAKEYHFLWGESEYKHRLLGVRKPLYRIAVYRSPMAIVQNSGLAAGMTLGSLSYRAKLGLRERARRADMAGSVLRAVIDTANHCCSAAEKLDWRVRRSHATPELRISGQPPDDVSG